MKLSDYIARFLVQQGVRHVFAITGGASAHLIDSVAKTKGIEYVCNQHEQASAMAADAYARATGDIGVVMATSGPGATNLLTGVCCSFYDSVPLLCLTGQVSTFRLKKDMGVRQLGFQETDVVDIFKPVTKYAVQLREAGKIRYELEKAVHIARSGRPGPVLIDIPDNLQRAEVEPARLEAFIPGKKKPVPYEKALAQCLQLVQKARRPVIVLGWGVQLSHAGKEAKALVEQLGFPVVLTWALRHLLPENHPQVVGSFGTHGTRYGNFTIQNADLVFVVGARMDTRGAGSPMDSFARGARKIVVDIDPAELGKFALLGARPDVLVQADARDFLQKMNVRLKKVRLPDISDWEKTVQGWKKKYPICPAGYYKQKTVDPYVFVKELSRVMPENVMMFVDSGCAVGWMGQAFDFKRGQQLFSAFNNTPMGYALPAAIGGSFALNKGPAVCLSGDGGLQMNIQELATVIRHDLPVKIFLFNNHGYSMIQQTQEQWLDGNYAASSVDGGLAFPDFVKVGRAYGFKTITISKNAELKEKLRQVLACPGPVFCNVEIPSNCRIVPQVKYGRPIEDSEPLLERKEFLDNMLVTPDKASLA